MKNGFAAALCLIAASSIASATVTISVSVGMIRDAFGNAAPLGSVGILIADVGGNGFSGDYTQSSFSSASALLDGFSFSTGALFGGDLVLGTFTVGDEMGFNGFNDNLSSLVYDSGFQEGTPLALMWFPTVFDADSLFSYGTSYGFYSNALNSESSGSDIGFVAPRDGLSVMLAVFDNTIVGDGIAVPTIGQLTAQAIPEPATYAIMLGCTALGFMALRRRK